MSVGAVMQHVAEALERAHALFGGTPASPTSTGGFAGATDQLAASGPAMAGLSGRLPAGYRAFAVDDRLALDGLARADDALDSGMGDAAEANRHGRNASGRIVDGAVVDTARIAPLTGTPAGQQALLTALRDRIIQQQRVVAAYQARDARLAALVRGLIYHRPPAVGGGGLSGVGGAGGFPSRGGLGMPSFPGAGMRGSGESVGAPTIVRTADWSVPAGPGGRAAAAALRERGRPYGWGAKGPNAFDCSGLTQWAWGQAGVRLGADTYAQICDGVPVAPDEVRAGDLIFPRSSFGAGGRPGPGHVMLAISPTEVVHAPHTGDVVRVAPMPSSFVARRPVPLTAL